MTKRTLILLIICLLSPATWAQLTVGSLFALKRTADGIISETENIIDRQRQQALIDLSALITYSFDSIDGSLDDLDRKLTRKERNLYAQLEKLLNQAEKAIEEQRIELFQDLDKTVGNTVAELPFTKNNPYPTRVISPFICETDSGKILIRLEGVKLDNELNYVEFNNKKSSKTYIESKSEISFELPIDSLNLNVGNQNILKFHLHKNKRKSFIFEVPIWVYPKKFAEITFYYTYHEDVSTTEHKTKDIEVRSPNGCNWKEHSTNIARINSGQWKIITTSVSVSERRQANGGGDCYIGNITPAQIGTKVTARSDCRGWRNLNPQRGTTVCRYSWTEELITPTERKDSITVSLNYNEALALTDFPYEISQFKKAKIVYYNGQVFEFIDTDYNNGLISYEYDGTRSSIQVKSVFNGFTLN